MGRIRKTIALGLPVVRPESSAEQIGRVQNTLLAQIAGQLPGRVAKGTRVTVCPSCVNRGCDKAMGGRSRWTQSASLCDCPYITEPGYAKEGHGWRPWPSSFTPASDPDTEAVLAS